MQRQSQNPVYTQFEHLLPSSGRYPAKHIDIFWNLDSDGKVTDTEVVFVPREALRDKELQAKYAEFNEQWASDLGNSLADWLKEDGLTPEGIFGHLLHHGFASEGALGNTLKEFAHIEESEWARRMLRGFRDE